MIGHHCVILAYFQVWSGGYEDCHSKPACCSVSVLESLQAKQSCFISYINTWNKEGLVSFGFLSDLWIKYPFVILCEGSMVWGIKII